MLKNMFQLWVLKVFPSPHVEQYQFVPKVVISTYDNTASVRLRECTHFVSNKLKEDVASRYYSYLAMGRAIKGGNLVGIINFSSEGFNPTKIIFSYFFLFPE